MCVYIYIIYIKRGEERKSYRKRGEEKEENMGDGRFITIIKEKKGIRDWIKNNYKHDKSLSSPIMFAYIKQILSQKQIPACIILYQTLKHCKSVTTFLNEPEIIFYAQISSIAIYGLNIVKCFQVLPFDTNIFL